MSEVKTPNEKLRDYLNLYFGPQNDPRGDELEVRFGTKKHVTQIQFDDVIAKLKSVGFSTENPQGKYHMNVQSEFVDPRSGMTKISNVRTEISNNIVKQILWMLNLEPLLLFKKIGKWLMKHICNQLIIMILDFASIIKRR